MQCFTYLQMRKKNDDLENKLTFKDKQVENLENEIKMTMAKLLLSEVIFAFDRVFGHFKFHITFLPGEQFKSKFRA